VRCALFTEIPHYRIEDFEFLPSEPEAEPAQSNIQSTQPASGGNGIHVGGDERMLRARAYARKIDPAVEGKHGDDATFRAACKTLRGFDLSEDECFQVLWEEFNPRCAPAWSEDELREKIRNAREYGKELVGGKLNSSRQRPEQPPPLSDADLAELAAEREAIQHENEEPTLEPANDEQTAFFVPQEYWQLYDVANIHDWECPKLEPVIDGILAKGNLCWIAAETQTGKTLFMLWVCLQLLHKGMLFGKYAITPINRILYVGCEDPARRFKARLLDMAPSAIEAGRFQVFVAPGLSIADKLCFLFLEKMIEDGGFDLVVIDTFQAATMGISSFDDEKLSVVIRHLLNITRRLGTTIIINDHFRKTANHKKRIDLDFNDVKGSGGKLQNADVFLLMDRQDGQLRISGKSKDWDKQIGFLLDIAPQGSQCAEKFVFAGDLDLLRAKSKEKAEATRTSVREAVGADWISAKDAAKKAGVKERTAQGYLKKLVDAGELESNGKQRGCLYRRNLCADKNTESAQTPTPFK